MKHNLFYKLLKEKYNILEATIDEDNDNIVIRSNDGRTFTHLDFTEAEIAAAEEKLIFEKAQAEAEAAAKKAAAEAKLAALGFTADDLKALGLGGN